MSSGGYRVRDWLWLHLVNSSGISTEDCHRFQSDTFNKQSTRCRTKRPLAQHWFAFFGPCLVVTEQFIPNQILVQYCPNLSQWVLQQPLFLERWFRRATVPVPVLQLSLPTIRRYKCRKNKQDSHPRGPGLDTPGTFKSVSGKTLGGSLVL